MKTEFEAEVREAFAARAARLPVDAASRLRSIDYGPRGHRLRAPAIGVGALAGAATAGMALAVVLGGSTPAYAGWSASPTSAPSPSPSPAADASCQSQLSGTRPGQAGPGLGSGPWQSVLTDVRGPFTVALFQNDGAYAACFTSPSFTEINELSSSPTAGGAQSGELSVHSASAGAGSGGSGPAAGQSAVVLEGTSSGDLNQVVENHLSTTSQGPYTLIDGRVANGVTGVTLVRDDGQDVVATVDDGWFVAWWPGADSPATSAQVTKVSGTTTEPFVPSAKLAAPGSCTSTAGTAHCAGGNTGQIRSGNSGSSGNTGNSGNIARPGQSAGNTGGTGTGPSTKSVP
jgi:hypothetical protein